MDLYKDFDNVQIHAFWSNKITTLVQKMTTLPAKSYAGQHDLVLHFINETLFKGMGKFNKEFRVKGRKYFDLKVPVKESTKEFEVVELMLRTSQLKYLKNELNKREEVFSTSDHLYFSYLLQAVSKEEGKIILERKCIYYVVIINISKQTLLIPINKLVEEIKMGTKHFTKELAKKSGIDEEKEELLGVENIIKVVDLERKLSAKEAELKDKDKIIEEKEKQLNEKDKEIARLKAQLKKK